MSSKKLEERALAGGAAEGPEAAPGPRGAQPGTGPQAGAEGTPGPGGGEGPDRDHHHPEPGPGPSPPEGPRPQAAGPGEGPGQEGGGEARDHKGPPHRQHSAPGNYRPTRKHGTPPPQAPKPPTPKPETEPGAPLRHGKRREAARTTTGRKPGPGPTKETSTRPPGLRGPARSGARQRRHQASEPHEERQQRKEGKKPP